MDGRLPRRDVLRAAGPAALGITSAALPRPAAAASPIPDGSLSLAATTVTVTPRGYGTSGTTGALDVSWSTVANATSYRVWGRTGSDPFVELGEVVADPSTSTAITGLSADSTYDVYVVASSSDPAYSSSLSETVSASSSIATGGTIGLYQDGSTFYVVHAFTHDGSASGQASFTFDLRRALAVDHLVVGGGGGGGGDVGGGGGAGGLVTTVTTARGAGGFGSTGIG